MLLAVNPTTHYHNTGALECEQVIDDAPAPITMGNKVGRSVSLSVSDWKALCANEGLACETDGVIFESLSVGFDSKKATLMVAGLPEFELFTSGDKFYRLSFPLRASAEGWFVEGKLSLIIERVVGGFQVAEQNLLVSTVSHTFHGQFANVRSADRYHAFDVLGDELLSMYVALDGSILTPGSISRKAVSVLIEEGYSRDLTR